ncbi:MAG: 50S ribosomal protein L13 [Rickettsiales bacterium]|jgi:large subunit ribosomal protein L13|nr:50S ribosomal protein L13 [Rickettsiales bacterium]
MVQKTYTARPKDVVRKWYVIDAEGLVLGRLASVAATYLRGKHKPTYTPHIDTGDNIIVINAAKVATTGGKENKNKFFYYTGFAGGIKERLWSAILGGKRPESLVEKAVERMISRNPLGRAMMKKLYVYAGAEHPHTAQNPEKLDVAKMNPKNSKRGA